MKILSKLKAIFGILLFFLLIVPAGICLMKADIHLFREWVLNMAPFAFLLVMYEIFTKNTPAK